MGLLDPKLLQAKRLADAKRAALEQQEAETEKINRQCERGFEALWQAKMHAVQQGLGPFHHAFSELQNVSLEVDTGREEVPKIDEVTIAEVGSLQPSAVNVLGGPLSPAWPAPRPTGLRPAPSWLSRRQRLPGQRSAPCQARPHRMQRSRGWAAAR